VSISQNARRLLLEGPVTSRLVGGSPAGIELGFLFDDAPAAYQRAIAAGCTSVVAAREAAVGATIELVRDDEGVLVELCTPRSRG
jgi:uncharacterized glyoxalase superfamily protein PhnB